jgi:hypothetical protein
MIVTVVGQSISTAREIARELALLLAKSLRPSVAD